MEVTGVYMYKPFRRAIKPLFPPIHRLLVRRHPRALWGGDPTSGRVALTFDDGPCVRDTVPLLQTLARHGVTATFFVLGERLQKVPASLLREVQAAGHQVAIHGYRHRPFPFTNTGELHRELDRTRDLIAEACGVQASTVRDVRSPYGLYTSGLLERLWQWQYRSVMWSVVPPHWVQSREQTVSDLVHQVQAGSLIVLHEGQTSGPSIAGIVETVVPRLLSRGLKFININQMWRE